MIVSVIICFTLFMPPISEKLNFFSLHIFTLCNERGILFSKTLFKIVLFKTELPNGK